MFGFCMKIREMLYKGRYLHENKLFSHKMEVFLFVLCKMLINYKVIFKMPSNIKVQHLLAPITYQILDQRCESLINQYNVHNCSYIRMDFNDKG
jgi:hypothetical protein